MGAIVIDMLNRLVQTLHDTNRQDGVQVLGVPVVFSGGNHVDQLPGTLATAQFDALGAKLFSHCRQKFCRDGLIHQQGFHRAANAITVGLGVERNALRLGKIGMGTDVYMADAVQVFDHRHLGITADPFDQPLAAARHDDINVLGHGDQRADSGTIGHFNHLHHGGRQTGFGQAALDAHCNGTVGVNRLGATAQDGCVARLQAQAGSINGHVRTRLVDDSDYTQRYTHLADLNTRRAVAHVANRADGVWQACHLTQTDNHAVDACRGQRQALQHGRLKAVGPAGGQVQFVGSNQLQTCGIQCSSSAVQGTVFLRRTGTADHTGGFASSATQAGHVVKNGLSHGLKGLGREESGRL